MTIIFVALLDADASAKELHVLDGRRRVRELGVADANIASRNNRFFAMHMVVARLENNIFR